MQNSSWRASPTPLAAPGAPATTKQWDTSYGPARTHALYARAKHLDYKVLIIFPCQILFVMGYHLPWPPTPPPTTGACSTSTLLVQHPHLWDLYQTQRNASTTTRRPFCATLAAGGHRQPMPLRQFLRQT